MAETKSKVKRFSWKLSPYVYRKMKFNFRNLYVESRFLRTELFPEASYVGATNPSTPSHTPFPFRPCTDTWRGEERTQTFLGREVEELIHFVRLQLDLRNNGLARRIDLKEEFHTQFLKTSNSPAETLGGAIRHLCFPLRTALPLWSQLRPS